MRVLIGCELYGVVRDAFRERGHEAWSCDLLGPDDLPDVFKNQRWPNYHLEGNVLDFLDAAPGGEPWDMMIAFPPCDHLAVSGARWFKEKRADGRQQAAIEFARTLLDSKIPKVGVENPVGVLSTAIRKPDQIIQPWQFGHGETKATCLWLKNLPLLVPTHIVGGREQRVWKMGPSPDRGRLRGITYTGIAAAMAEQWGGLTG